MMIPDFSKDITSSLKSATSKETTTLSYYIISLCKQYKLYLLSLLIIGIAAAFFNIAVDYKIKEIIDIIQLNSSANLNLLLILFVLYKSMHHGVYFINRLLDIKYKPRLLIDTISTMYTSTIKHSLHWFDSHLSGEIASKITDFQGALLPLITSCLRALINIFTIIIIITFLLDINLVPALILLGFICIYTPVIYFLLKKQMKLQEQFVLARQETVGFINDSITNIFGIKVIGNIWAEFKLKLLPALANWQKWERRTKQFDAYWVDNADTIMVTIMSAVQIYTLASLYQAGQITAGGFAFTAMMTLKIHGELDSFLDQLLFNINPGIASLKSSYTFINSSYDVQDKPSALTVSKIKGRIRFEGVYFSYRTNNDVFQDLNLIIEPGQRVGIVGTSGAGKTTFIKCLLRYFDISKGKIFIDEYNISDITQESLWANISIIPQDITMFHRTVLENLKVAKYDASVEEIMNACKKAHIHNDIMLMTQDYNSVVGERGVKLSGGQRQRIAIARAILKKSPILILDEATSALDTPTEQLIQESLARMLDENKCTSIVVAHRLSTLLHLDRILVFDQGKIIEDGTHQELLAKNGRYKALWDAQVGGFLPE